LRAEVEVRRVLAREHSNQEIGGPLLFISPRTVQVHPRSVFSRLGVSSRAEAIAFAHRHDIT